MVYIVKPGITRKEFDKLLKKATPKPKKLFNARKYCGILKLDEDPVTLQRRWRDEWE